MYFQSYPDGVRVLHGACFQSDDAAARYGPTFTQPAAAAAQVQISSNLGLADGIEYSA